MLKTVALSSNKKTGPIAVTYRAGEHETYGTCPRSCGLHPKSETGTTLIDADYLSAVYDACPRDGVAWTYSHFAPELLPVPKVGKTTFNASCDDMGEAASAHQSGVPAVYVAQHDSAVLWPAKFNAVKFVRCPAELADNFTCQQCGNGSPLCSRGTTERDYVIVFVGHGTGKKRIGTGTGGCYAASGPTAIQWHNTKKTGLANDADAVRGFAKSLPRRSFLRHHVAGDVGLESVGP